MRLKTPIRGFIAAAAVGIMCTTAALPAQAGSITVKASAGTARNGVCESGEFCYYFNSGAKGSVSDFDSSFSDYGSTQPKCFDFRSLGNGQGKCVKNNAASVWNRTDSTVRVYFNSNFNGSVAQQDFSPAAKGNLNDKLKNNNASHAFLERNTNPPPPPPPLPAKPSRAELDRMAGSVVTGGVGKGLLQGIRADPFWGDFNWDNDGCSVPQWVLKVPGANWSINNVSEVILEACIIHDFGYKNFGGSGLRLDPTEQRRAQIDQALKDNGHTLCDARFPRKYLDAQSRFSCNNNVNVFYTAVRLKGEAHFQGGS